MAAYFVLNIVNQGGGGDHCCTVIVGSLRPTLTIIFTNSFCWCGYLIVRDTGDSYQNFALVTIKLHNSRLTIVFEIVSCEADLLHRGNCLHAAQSEKLPCQQVYCLRTRKYSSSDCTEQRCTMERELS